MYLYASSIYCCFLPLITTIQRNRRKINEGSTEDERRMIGRRPEDPGRKYPAGRAQLRRRYRRSTPESSCELRAMGFELEK